MVNPRRQNVFISAKRSDVAATSFQNVLSSRKRSAVAGHNDRTCWSGNVLSLRPGQMAKNPRRQNVCNVSKRSTVAGFTLHTHDDRTFPRKANVLSSRRTKIATRGNQNVLSSRPGKMANNPRRQNVCIVSKRSDVAARKTFCRCGG